jgi:hypothetical protein
LILTELESNTKNFASLVDGYFPKDDFIWEMIFVKAFGEKNPTTNPTREEYLKVKDMNNMERKRYAKAQNMKIFRRKIYYSERLFILPFLSEVKIFLHLGADIHMLTEVSFKNTITYMTYEELVSTVDYKKDIKDYLLNNGYFYS